MDTSAIMNKELRDATVNRKKQPGYRCLGKQRDGNYAIMVGAVTGTVDGNQLMKLSAVVKKYAAGGHFTTAQSMVIVGIKEENFNNAKQAVFAKNPTFGSGTGGKVPWAANSYEIQNQCFGLSKLLRKYDAQRFWYPRNDARLENLYWWQDGDKARYRSRTC
jgi:dissimilatory sulfite reductase (desulfoviridin) alpha/beta subunit